MFTLCLCLFPFLLPVGLGQCDNALASQIEKVISGLNSQLTIADCYTTGDGELHQNDYSSLTVLTALTDIGVIKGNEDVTDKNPNLYLEWLEIFSVIYNPVVFFTDQTYIAERMKDIRQHLPTLIIIYDKYSSWAFGHVAPLYQDIFISETYPKHHPNTEYPEYASMTHAKIEFMQIVSTLNHFHTDLLAWLDCGFYRDYVLDGDFTPFVLAKPDQFNSNKLAVNNIRLPLDEERDDHRYIMKYSPSFISGGFWFGNATLLQTFTAEYMQLVEILIDEGLANCEEQVLASMFLESTQFQPTVDAQMFPVLDSCDPWMCLGHTLREIGLVNS